MTVTVSLPLSSLTPPESHADFDAWLAGHEEALSILMGEEMARLVGEALERYAAGLEVVTAASDPSALDGVSVAWRAFVNEVVIEYVGGLYLSGNLAAYTIAPTAPADWAAVVNRNALDYQQVATNRIMRASDDVWGEINAKVLTGLNDGMDGRKIAREIEAITQYSSNRAMAIARTETVGAYNGGDLDGAFALGDLGPVAKGWLATGDARTRLDHAEANGQIVGLRQKFDVGGVSMDRPHDPSAPADQVVNCRCTTLLYYADDPALAGTPFAGNAPGVERDISNPVLPEGLQVVKNGRLR